MADLKHVRDYHARGQTLSEAYEVLELLQDHLLVDHRLRFYPKFMNSLRALEGNLTRYRHRELNRLHDELHELLLRGEVPALEEHFHFLIQEQEL